MLNVQQNEKQLNANRENNTEHKRNSRQSEKTFIAQHGLNTFDETAVNPHDVGPMEYTCSECGALMFKEENSDKTPSGDNKSTKFSLCCSYGAIKLPPTKEPPEKLKSLLTGSTKQDRDFQKNIRAYNSSLAFASMCLSHHGKEYKFRTNGPYCYRINGQVYYSLSQMQPEHGKKPNFSQIYIYDQENELDNHLQSFQDLDRKVLKELQDMIKEVNPYAELYRQAGDIIRDNPTENIKLILRSHDEKSNIDPRRFNLSTGTDVAVILPVDMENTTERERCHSLQKC